MLSTAIPHTGKHWKTARQTLQNDAPRNSVKPRKMSSNCTTTSVCFKRVSASGRLFGSGNPRVSVFSPQQLSCQTWRSSSITTLPSHTHAAAAVSSTLRRIVLLLNSACLYCWSWLTCGRSSSMLAADMASGGLNVPWRITPSGHVIWLELGAGGTASLSYCRRPTVSLSIPQPPLAAAPGGPGSCHCGCHQPPATNLPVYCITFLPLPGGRGGLSSMSPWLSPVLVTPPPP